jgi:hypothetical protein
MRCLHPILGAANGGVASAVRASASTEGDLAGRQSGRLGRTAQRCLALPARAGLCESFDPSTLQAQRRAPCPWSLLLIAAATAWHIQRAGAGAGWATADLCVYARLPPRPALLPQQPAGMLGSVSRCMPGYNLSSMAGACCSLSPVHANHYRAGGRHHDPAAAAAAGSSSRHEQPTLAPCASGQSTCGSGMMSDHLAGGSASSQQAATNAAQQRSGGAAGTDAALARSLGGQAPTLPVQAPQVAAAAGTCCCCWLPSCPGTCPQGPSRGASGRRDEVRCQSQTPDGARPAPPLVVMRAWCRRELALGVRPEP